MDDRNAGIVSGGGPSTSFGIDLRAGGTITNSGQISGSHYGVRIQGATGTVTNTGSITSGSDGVVLFAGGSVSNAAGGLITGTLNAGVYVSGGAATVTNAGTIDGFVNSDAVQIIGGFTDRMIVDPGAVFVGKVEGGNAIGASSISTLELAGGASTGTLSSLGSKYVDFAQVVVDPGASWRLTGTNSIVSGATLSGSGTLTNAGKLSVASVGGLTLSGGAVTNTTLATIYGSYGALGMSNGSVVNAGTINGHGTRNTGVSLNVGFVINQTSGTIAGGYVGVVVDGGGGTLVNYGLIEGSGAVADGIAASGGGLVINEPNATISAPNFCGVETYNILTTVTNSVSLGAIRHPAGRRRGGQQPAGRHRRRVPSSE